jgi:hypothetical protein
MDTVLHCFVHRIHRRAPIGLRFSPSHNFLIADCKMIQIWIYRSDGHASKPSPAGKAKERDGPTAI